MIGRVRGKARVTVRVQRPDGTWTEQHTEVPDDLLTRLVADRDQDAALQAVGRAFTLAYGLAYPRMPGKHRHRKVEGNRE